MAVLPLAPGIKAMPRPLSLALAAVLLAAPAWGQEGKAVILMADPATGRTVGKVGGEPVILQNNGTTTVGKIGKDRGLTTTDAQGNTVGKVGDKRLLCQRDTASGVTICK